MPLNMKNDEMSDDEEHMLRGGESGGRLPMRFEK